MDVTLTDSADKNVSATARLVRDGRNTRIITSGGDAAVSVAGFGVIDKTSSLGFSSGAFVLGGNRVAVTKTDDGAAFTGFPSGKVNVKVTVIGDGGGANIKINSINGQALSSLRPRSISAAFTAVRTKRARS